MHLSHRIQLAAGAAALLSACSDDALDSTATASGQGGFQYTASASIGAGGVPGEGGAGDASSSTGTGGSMQELNGCTPATFEDLTGQASVEIHFVGATDHYDLPCVMVSPGTVVTFVADQSTFGEHPLRGGVVQMGMTQLDPNTPFSPPPPATETSASYTMTASKNHPFYCEAHAAQEGAGVVRVTP